MLFLSDINMSNLIFIINILNRCNFYFKQTQVTHITMETIIRVLTPLIKVPDCAQQHKRHKFATTELVNCDLHFQRAQAFFYRSRI